MKRAKTTIPPRATQQHEEEGLEYAELCIRVMERFLAAVADRPEMADVYTDLLDTYADLLQDELAPYAFDLAYELFSQDEVAKERRRERDRTT